MFDKIVGCNAKIVFHDGDTSSVYYGKILSFDGNFFEVSTKNKISFISTNQIHKIEVIEDEVAK